MRLIVQGPGGGDEGQGEADGGEDHKEGVKHRKHQQQLTK